MKEELIKDGDTLIAVILRNGKYPKGLKFYSQNQDFIQVGTWNYSKGQKIKPHIHILGQKKVNRTQEVLYVKSGEVKVNTYNEAGTLIDMTTLRKGDLIIQLAGGHSFEILQDDTQVLMIKNGPYYGMEKDKKIIE